MCGDQVKAPRSRRQILIVATVCARASVMAARLAPGAYARALHGVPMLAAPAAVCPRKACARVAAIHITG
ncbi:hypothetical protein D9M69_678810 [compost metagenome]